MIPPKRPVSLSRKTYISFTGIFLLLLLLILLWFLFCPVFLFFLVFIIILIVLFLALILIVAFLLVLTIRISILINYYILLYINLHVLIIMYFNTCTIKIDYILRVILLRRTFFYILHGVFISFLLICLRNRRYLFELKVSSCSLCYTFWVIMITKFGW